MIDANENTITCNCSLSLLPKIELIALNPFRSSLLSSSGTEGQLKWNCVYSSLFFIVQHRFKNFDYQATELIEKVCSYFYVYHEWKKKVNKSFTANQ